MHLGALIQQEMFSYSVKPSWHWAQMYSSFAPLVICFPKDCLNKDLTSGINLQTKAQLFLAFTTSAESRSWNCIY